MITAAVKKNPHQIWDSPWPVKMPENKEAIFVSITPTMLSFWWSCLFQVAEATIVKHLLKILKIHSNSESFSGINTTPEYFSGYM